MDSAGGLIQELNFGSEFSRTFFFLFFIWYKGSFKIGGLTCYSVGWDGGRGACAPPRGWQLLNSVDGACRPSFKDCGYSCEMSQLSKLCEDKCGLLVARLPCLLESSKERPRQGPRRGGL